jgi:OOP family OmpA-OmpF porin
MSEPDTEADELRPLALLIGGVGAIVSMILGLAAPHDGAVWRMPQVLHERVAEALSVAGYPGLDISMDGQRAVLRGIVESEADIAAARHAALTAAGAGTPWAGGVTGVDVAGVSVGPFERPYQWSARREPARIVLSGAVPSESVRAQLAAAAREAFPNFEPVDEMRVAGGAPSPEFGAVASSAARALAGLNIGEVRIVDAQIAFIGDGAEQGVRALRAAFARPPAPFHVRFAVTVDGLDLDHPELQGLNLVSGDAETCKRAFDRLMERNVINFATNSATIELSSRGVLDSLASVALRCDRFSIEVAGHTDNQGAREANMELSRQRADAVANYLAAQGVERSRLSSRGYGPDRPRVSNDTPTSRAINRRIEFYVSS